MMTEITPDEITRLVRAIDYSEVLTITATQREVRAACSTALQYGFRAVVAFPVHVPVLVDALKGSSVLPQIPVGFPSGGGTTLVKCTEAEEGLKAGAADLDMVMNISAFKQRDYKKVSRDIAEVMKVAEPFAVPFKVIIEVGALSDEEKVEASRLVKDSGADFIKTCTGFGPGRVTLHDIMLIRRTIGEHPGIKASGGVASLEDGVACMRAGADIVAMRGILVEQLQCLGWPKKS